MTFDFDTPVNRKGINSLKWDIKENELPMWVADMDFKTAPCVISALQKRLENGTFGYSYIPDEWYEAYISRWKNYHHFEIDRDWLIFSAGVVPAVSSLVRKLSTPAEKVLVQTPVYNIFFNSILNNGRVPLESPLKLIEKADAETGASLLHYEMDFEALDTALSDPQCSLMILCNPQNPGGEIWSRETLIRLAGLCKKHGVTVISDEIHCDICAEGKEYVPFAGVSDTAAEISLSCISPSKAFNIAGLHSAAVVVPDKFLRHKAWRALNTDEVAEPNVFAVQAAVAALTEGGEWLNQLNSYIFENKKLAAAFIADQLPKLGIMAGDATYLMWLDCRKYLDIKKDLTEEIRKSTGLFLSGGAQYGKEGKGFMRMNLACPRCYVEDGLNRLKTALSPLV